MNSILFLLRNHIWIYTRFFLFLWHTFYITAIILYFAPSIILWTGEATKVFLFPLFPSIPIFSHSFTALFLFFSYSIPAPSLFFYHSYHALSLFCFHSFPALSLFFMHSSSVLSPLKNYRCKWALCNIYKIYPGSLQISYFFLLHCALFSKHVTLLTQHRVYLELAECKWNCMRTLTIWYSTSCKILQDPCHFSSTPALSLLFSHSFPALSLLFSRSFPLFLFFCTLSLPYPYSFPFFPYPIHILYALFPCPITIKNLLDGLYAIFISYPGSLQISYFVLVTLCPVLKTCSIADRIDLQVLQ